MITDSEGAYGLSKSPKFARRSRHIEHRFHYISPTASESRPPQYLNNPGERQPSGPAHETAPHEHTDNLESEMDEFMETYLGITEA